MADRYLTRREAARRHEPQPTPPPATPLPLAQRERRGLVKRAKARVSRHYVHRFLASPAGAPIVAVCVVGVLAAVAVGALLAALVVAAHREGGAA